MIPFVSIICPTYNEEKYIAQCIDSLLQQDYPLNQLEILFVDGMSTDRTREIIKQYIARYPFIRLLDNPHKTVPYALNTGIRNAQGDIIIRLDAHAGYPQNYFLLLTAKLRSTHADNVGGICRTLPARETTGCKAIAIALSHPFGVGNSHFRTGANKERQVDTVPFGCFRKDIFERIGFFDEELARNQDDEFNGRIIKNGGTILLVPSLVVHYYARDTLGKMSKMYYQYGLFKPLVNKKLGRPATVRQFFPALFLCGLLAGAALSFCSAGILWIYLSVLLCYSLTGLAIGAQKAKTCKDTKLIYYMPVTFFIIHLSYGWGYMVGICKILTKSGFQVKVNR
jgi:glycosyltransferase involved in cell wall biosynthesis